MVWGTKLGYEAREMISSWEAVLLREQKNRQVKMFIEGGGFVMFFEFEKSIYGATEPHRVVYSKMCSPDSEATPEWCKEAHFQSFNLSKAILGKPAQEIFDYDDVKRIDVIDKEQAYDKLVEIAEEANPEKLMSGTAAIFKALANMQKDKPDIPLNQGKK